jgi:hypothetical protein
MRLKFEGAQELGLLPPAIFNHRVLASIDEQGVSSDILMGLAEVGVDYR